MSEATRGSSLKAASPRLPVMKLVGTGNDFLFIDARDELPGPFAQIPRAEIVRKLCDRHFGLGSDGVVFVEQADAKYHWDFYNTDGTHAEMCGNATRCLGRWAQLKLHLSSIEFQTLAGHVEVKVEGSNMSSYLHFVSAKARYMPLTVAGREVGVYLIDTGVPHFVAKVDDIAKARMQLEMIRELRFHREGGPRGANVTFLKVIGPSNFETVTYERGVEDFTLSCGTGVIAAAAVGLQWHDPNAALDSSRPTAQLTADVTTPGGILSVRFEEDFAGVTLTGPALKVYETELNEEFFK